MFIDHISPSNIVDTLTFIFSFIQIKIHRGIHIELITLSHMIKLPVMCFSLDLIQVYAFKHGIQPYNFEWSDIFTMIMYGNTVSKRSFGQTSYFSGCNIGGCLLYGHSSLPCTFIFNCASTSYAMDWFAPCVWMDIHSILLIVRKLYLHNPSMGNIRGPSIIFPLTSRIFRIWFWKRYILL